MDVTYYTNRDPHVVTDANGRSQTYKWHPNGLLDTVTDSATSDEIEVEYDTNWRPTTTKVNGQPITTTTYDVEGRLTAFFDHGTSYLTTFAHDALNRLYREDHPDQSFVEQVWECCYPTETRVGRTIGGQDRILERTLTKYDGRGLPIQTKDSAGRITRFGYDGTGRLATLTDANSNVTTWVHDDYGRLEKKVFPDDTEEITEWKNMVQLKKLTDRRNEFIYGIEYDWHGNLTKMLTADFIHERTYDSWDRLDLVKHNPSGTPPLEIHDFDYDLLGRITQIDGPWSNDTIEWQYVDAQRKVIRTTPGSVVTESVSDAFGRLDFVENPLGRFTRSYTAESRQLTGITHTLGDNNGTAYAGLDAAFTCHGDTFRQALATITSSLPGGSTVAKHTYGYDDLGRITSWRREAPLANPSGATREFEWKSFYDFSSQLTSVFERNLGGTMQRAWHYGYDAIGNIKSTQLHFDTTSAASMTLRSHNNLNQITSIGGGGDALVRGTLDEPGTVSVTLGGGPEKPARLLAGNRFETELPLQPGANSLGVEAMDMSGNRSSYTYDVSVDVPTPHNPSYDLAGNLLSDGIRSYEWDTLSRLTKITWETGKTTEFRYNGLGQRSEQIDTDNGSSASTYFLYDGVALLDRRSGVVTEIDRRYFSEGQQRKSAGTWTNFHYSRDHLGSVREVVRWDGSLVARYDYDPFGRRRAQYEAASWGGPCEFGFTGHATVENPVVGQGEILLTQYRAYDPELGAWLSPDPLGEAGGINLYGYVGNDPINSWDPLGLSPSNDPFALVDSFAENPHQSTAGMCHGSSVDKEAAVAEAKQAAGETGQFMADVAPVPAAKAGLLMGFFKFLRFGRRAAPAAKQLLREGETYIGIIKDGKVLKHPAELGLSHKEWARKVGALADDGQNLKKGCEAVTFGKVDGKLITGGSGNFGRHISDSADALVRSQFE